jgi:hypothetical protein
VLTAVRHVLYVVSLAGRRLARRSGRVLFVAVGICAGAAALATLLVASTIARDRSLRNAVADVPPEQRVIRASWFGSLPDPREYEAKLDPFVQKTLAPFNSRPLRVMTYREVSVDGKLFDLAAADQLAQWIRLRSGRLPRQCSPTRCEVLQLGGTGPVPNVAGLPLQRVGRADLVSSVPFLRRTAYGRNVEDAYSFSLSNRAPPFLITGDVAGATELRSLRWVRRSYGWIVPLSPGQIHPWSLGRLTQRVDRARATLEAESFYFDLADPLQELGDAASRGRVAGTRLLLIGGEAVALLFAFAALSAAATRRESALTRWRLERAGARAFQTRLLTGTETVGLAGVATLVGWGLGIGIGAIVARVAGGPVATVLVQSAASERGLVIALALAVAAAGVLALSFSARRSRSRPFALSALDVAALGALATIGLALARGVADVDALAQGRGTGWMLFALPLLVAFVVAVAAARAFHPVARVLERTTRNLSVPVRLAALSLARHPAQSIAASTFLLASVGLAVFSLAYRSTLVQGQDDRARFANPTGVIVRSPQPQRVPLFGGLSPQADHWLSQKGAVPLIRLDGLVGQPSRSVQVVGISAPTLRHPPFWRDDFASRSPQALAAAIDLGRSVFLKGVRLPTAASELVMPLKLDGDPLRIVLSFRGRGDQFVDVGLRARPSSNSSLTVRVPRAARGGLVLGMTFAPTEPDVHNSTPAGGTLELGKFRVRTSDGIHRLAMDLGQWIGVGGIRSRLSRNGVKLRYFVTNDVVSRFRPKQPTDQSPVPVIATAPIAELAGPNGLLPLQVEGEPFVGRVVATARRFPTVSGDFVLADREALSTALNADAPGSAVIDEIWLKSSSSSDETRIKAALSRPAFAGLETSFRRDLRAELDREPVARASILALLVSAFVGFVLALAGLTLALSTDIRDERAELFDLEAQGATPALLRRHLRLRSFGVLGFGVLFGLGLGAILSTIVVDVVRVTAGGQLPEPPLLLSFDWPLLLGGIGLFVLVAIVVAMVVTWQALRGARAVRGTG